MHPSPGETSKPDLCGRAISLVVAQGVPAPVTRAERDLQRDLAVASTKANSRATACAEAPARPGHSPDMKCLAAVGAARPDAGQVIVHCEHHD
jgi:hypothetical protein